MFVNFIIVFLGSFSIGYCFGLFSALLFKHFDFQNNKLIVVSVFINVVYIPYFLAEFFELSGIVTIIFTGISAKRYINKNISQSSKESSSFVFSLMSHLAETVVFLSLGGYFLTCRHFFFPRLTSPLLYHPNPLHHT